MNITISLDDDLVKEVRKIAVDNDTTLTGLIRTYLKTLAEEQSKFGRRRRERKALDESFERFKYHIGDRTWKRADLHARD